MSGWLIDHSHVLAARKWGDRPVFNRKKSGSDRVYLFMFVPTGKKIRSYDDEWMKRFLMIDLGPEVGGRVVLGWCREIEKTFKMIFVKICLWWMNEWTMVANRMAEWVTEPKTCGENLWDGSHFSSLGKRKISIDWKQIWRPSAGFKMRATAQMIHSDIEERRFKSTFRSFDKYLEGSF